MRELLIATRNKGKVPEMAAALAGLPFTLMSVDDVPALEGFDVEETGTTFEENALLKAKQYGDKSGKLTIADDSGLEVDALEGAPGVYSARYVLGTNVDRYNALLKNMNDIQDDRERGAQFHSTIAVYDPTTGRSITTEGICRGRILRAPVGEHGFGYDPIFYVDELGATFGEASLEEKQSVDHRAKAIKKMRELLLGEFI
ncbi:MAG: non-canonical purine pyrophosphatase [Candidatus Kaiserbacteria bacterium]|nr:non-canonical purine pyrophosphatase [Candidatus Kaiserbacteria bacterium]